MINLKRFVLQMPMEGDFFLGGAPAAPVAAPVAAPTATAAAASASSEPRFAGGPTNLSIGPMYSGGWSGTAGRESERVYTPEVLDSYFAYDPATGQQHMWNTAGQYLGVYKNDAWSGLKDFGKGFVLPALAMASGVGALGAAFGGATGAAQAAAMAAASPAATIGGALGITSPALASAAGNAIINTVVNGGDVKKAVTSAALNYGAGALSSATGAALSNAGVDPAIAKAVANAATGVVKAELTGGNPTSALISAGLSALTPALTPAATAPTPPPLSKPDTSFLGIDTGGYNPAKDISQLPAVDTSFPAITPDTSISGIDTGGYNPAKDIAQIGTGTVQADFNALVNKGVDPDTALATAVSWQAPSGGLAAVTAGSAPGSVGAAADQVVTPEALAPIIPSGLAAVTAGSAPGAAEAARLTSSPLDAIAADAGGTGSVPMAIGNEAVASGMSPGALGAKVAADNLLLDSQLAAAYGTPDVADLTGATDAAAKLKASVNEAVASGMSPGSVGAAQGAAGMLTDEQLMAAYGTTPAASTTTPAKAKNLLASLASLIPTGARATSAGTVTSAGSSGGLPFTFTDVGLNKTPGKYLTTGNAGYDMTPKELKQLYANLTSTPSSEYQYVADEAPLYVDVAALNRLPDTRYPSASAGSTPFASEFSSPDMFSGYANRPFATGGLVQPLADGGSAASDALKSLKALGELGGEMKPTKHDLRQVGAMGAPYTPRVLPQLASLLQARGMKLAQGGQPDDHTHPNYDGTPLLRTGGLTGLGGKYVEGKGDGTSDDIAAMLANGEYVFSADVVSALGNGSNKAGAKELDQMVQAIRSRARSAPPDELPPDAKSPLEYLKSSKGKKHG